jgi:segregation and condensation protein A
MPITIIREPIDYKVATPVYQGPLDLLLSLIENAELDVTSLALAEVTDQYLTHLRSLKNIDAEEVSSFLVIAAKLLQIKSEVLLPHPPIREAGEEDPGEELARQLRVYRRYKQIANILRSRGSQGLQTYLRLVSPPDIEAKVDLSRYTVQDIWSAARTAFNEAEDRQEVGTVVTPPKVTVREKVNLIVKRLRIGGATSFRTLLGKKRSRLEVVVTFIAMLELVRRHIIQANQESLFGEITLEASTSWDDEVDFELEFGE